MLILVGFASFGQSEDSFRVVKRPVVARQVFRSFLLPPYSANAALNVFTLDSNLISGDTLKLSSPSYRIKEYSLVVTSKGEIFKMGGLDGVIGYNFLQLTDRVKMLPGAIAFFTVEKLVNQKGELRNTNMSFRIRLN
jgi:hypothetical protein